MAIVFHKESRTFHLWNEQISDVFCVMKNGQLGQLYFGKKIRDREAFGHLLEESYRDMSPCAFEGDRMFSLENLKQEYPTFGSGDMREPAFQILQENGSKITDFVYVSHTIFAGKKPLEGLPAVYTEKDDEAQTLEITLRDELIQTELILSYTIFEEYPAICRSVRFVSHSDQKLVLTPAMSICLDLPDQNYEMVDLTGAWARERYVSVHPLHVGDSVRLQYARAQQPPVQSVLCPEASLCGRDAGGSAGIQSGVQRKFPWNSECRYIRNGARHDRYPSGRICLESEKR